jgi:rare lipoprotein A
MRCKLAEDFAVFPKHPCDPQRRLGPSLNTASLVQTTRQHWTPACAGDHGESRALLRELCAKQIVRAEAAKDAERRPSLTRHLPEESAILHISSPFKGNSPDGAHFSGRMWYTDEKGGGGMRGSALIAAALLLAPVSITEAKSSKRSYGTGQASYYSNAFAGRRTASGETYQPGALTAAHRTAPFGSRMRVTMISTGQFVIVRINDRGPFHKGRVIDLSYAAAKAIGLHRRGTGAVRLEAAD